MKTIAFDIDGTLIDRKGTPRDEVLMLLLGFSRLGYDVYIHSGGGIQYAEQMFNKIKSKFNWENNEPTLVAKGGHYDIAVDDMEYDKCDYLIKV